MPISFVTGDLFTHPGLDAWAHGCNCAGVMGGGIAVEFRRRFPRMYAEYRERCEQGRFSLGDVFMWREPGAPVVFNLATQLSGGTQAELWAIEASTNEMVRLAQSHKLNRIGMPRIGAGLGGLDWADVRSVLSRIGESAEVELVVFEGFEPSPYTS